MIIFEKIKEITVNNKPLLKIMKDEQLLWEKKIKKYIIKDGVFVDNKIVSNYYRVYNQSLSASTWGGNDNTISSTNDNGYWTTKITTDNTVYGGSDWYETGQRLFFKLDNPIKLPKGYKVTMEADVYAEFYVTDTGSSSGWGWWSNQQLLFGLINNIPPLNSGSKHGSTGTYGNEKYPFQVARICDLGIGTATAGTISATKSNLILSYTNNTTDDFQYFGYGYNVSGNGKYKNQYYLTQNAYLKIKNLYYENK